MKFIREKCSGNIFLIPLYLPAYQMWRDREDLINYGKYAFHMDDNYAFGRVIDTQKGGGDLIEVFQYIGKIPNNPNVITDSGRLFEPVHIMMAFSKKRYPFLFANTGYDKHKESDYENISFLLMTELWKGGQKTPICQDERSVLLQSGVQNWVVYTPTQLEERIRFLIEKAGISLNYDSIVEERKSEYPLRNISDAAFQKKISPFMWSINEDNTFSIFLTTGDYMHNLFLQHRLEGNGYDWEKLVLNVVNKNFPQMVETLRFDSEAGIFSVSSSDKKSLKTLALQIHQLCKNENEFCKVLIML